MFINLLAAIEADLNNLSTQIQTATQKQQGLTKVVQLAEKHEALKQLAMNYVALENQYREVSGLNSIY